MPAQAERPRRRRRRLWGVLASDLSEFTAVLHVHPSSSHDTLLRVPLPGPGVYRVEVDLRVDLFPIGGVAYRPWILSNPVYIHG